MNNKRRERIQKMISKLEDINTEISEILEEEQEAFDNMPENLQTSE